MDQGVLEEILNDRQLKRSCCCTNVREPDPDVLAKVTNMAKKTGDFATLACRFEGDCPDVPAIEGARRNGPSAGDNSAGGDDCVRPAPTGECWIEEGSGVLRW